MTQADKITGRLFVVEGLPIRYLVIPKCGCTYVKNVLWRLGQGRNHEAPLRIHDDDSLFRRASDFGLSPQDIVREEFAFTVIRNPIDRFLSLYFDKIVGRGRARFVPLAETLIEKRGLNESPRSVEEHRRNLLITIAWLGDNLANGVDLKTDAHWSPQVYRKNIMKSCDLKLLLVDELTVQLQYLLGTTVPEIYSVLEASERNASRKQLAKSSVLTREIRAAVNEVYAADKQLYQKVNKAWKAFDAAAPDCTGIPRYRALFGH